MNADEMVKLRVQHVTRAEPIWWSLKLSIPAGRQGCLDWSGQERPTRLPRLERPGGRA